MTANRRVSPDAEMTTCGPPAVRTLRASLAAIREKSMDDEELKGGCQCGAIRYEISGTPVIVAVCHCTMCRRANAAPAVAWAMFQESQVRFTRLLPAVYASS